MKALLDALKHLCQSDAAAEVC